MDMELPTIESTLPPRPLSLVVGLVPGKPPPPEVPQGVINDINPQVQALVHRNLSNTAPSTEPDRAAVWAPQPSAAPPHEPLSKMLMAHLHSVWTASARVVDQARLAVSDKNLLPTQEAVREQVQHRNLNPSAVPGMLAKASVTYTPSKVKKIDAA